MADDGDMSGGFGDSSYGGDYSGGLTGGLSSGLSDYSGAFGTVDFSGAGGGDFGMDGLQSIEVLGQRSPTDFGNFEGGFGDGDMSGGVGFGDGDMSGGYGGYGNTNTPNWWDDWEKNKLLNLAMLAAPPHIKAMWALAKTAKGMSQGGKKAGAVGGGYLGGIIGGQVAGLPGAVIGSWGGSKLGSNADLPGASGVPGAPSSGDSFLDKMIPTLGGLYAGMQGSKGIGGQIGNLESMYGQNSPYSTALRQQLERRDAASGRRSQYGPREVELQAQLARMASSNAPGLAALYGQRNAQRAAMLKSLMTGYDQMGGMRGIRGGLSDLFGGGGGGGGFSLDGIMDQPFDVGGLSGALPTELPGYDMPDFGFGG